MPISPGALPPIPTAPIAATAATPRLLSPRNLSTSFDKLDKPVFSSVIEPAIWVNDDETAVIELLKAHNVALVIADTAEWPYRDQTADWMATQLGVPKR